MVVWCIFVKTIHLIQEKMSKVGLRTSVIYGQTPKEERDAILGDFKKRRIDVLITNPNTLAESVSLHSVCHDAIYYEYSFNLIHLLQSKDRIHRLGLSDDQYTQYYFLQNVYDNFNNGYSLDEQIYERLSQKERLMLDAIASHHLEVQPTTDEELEMIFEGLFRQ